MKRHIRRLFWVCIGLVVLLLMVIASAFLILPSDWFREKVRARIVYEVERASGGRTEIGAFRFDWTTLTAEVAPFTLHGTEPAGEAPLFRAESVTVGLKIISILAKDIDIDFVRVEQPNVNILVDENGITNFPRPKIQRRSARDPIEQLVALKNGSIHLRNGTLHYGDQKIPLDVKGRRLNAKLSYNFKGPAYQGDLSMEETDIDAGPALPMTFGFKTNVALHPNRVVLREGRLSMKETTVDIAGFVEDFKNPRMDFDVSGTGALAELGKPLRLPIVHTGHASFTGKFTYDREAGVRLNGRMTGQHLAWREGRVNLHDLAMVADVDLHRRDVRLREVTVHALDGVFRGAVDIADFRTFKVNGNLTGVSVLSLTRMAGYPKAGFSGAVAGPVQVTGSFTSARDLRASGRFNVAASGGGVPVQGFVEAAWNGRRRSVELGNSNLKLPSSMVAFRGTFGEQLQVKLESSNLNELLPAFAFASDAPPEKLPLELRPGGSAQFEGTVTGPVDRAVIAGQVTLSGFEVADVNVDRLVATVNADAAGLRAKSVAVSQDTLRVTGSLDVGLTNWRFTDTSPINGSVKLANARIPALLAQAGHKLPIEGVLDAEVDLTGTRELPQANLQFVIRQPVVYGERFDRIRGGFRYRRAGVEFVGAAAEAGPSRILFGGAYQHPPGDFRNGTVKFRITTERWTLEQLQNVRQIHARAAGAVQVKGSGTLAVRNGQILPESLDGNITLNDLTVDGRAIGDFTANAQTSGQQLTLGVSGSLRGSKVTGNGVFELTGDYPGKGEVTFSPMTLATVQDLALAATGREPFPVDGFVSGALTFSGPVLKPDAMRARLELPTLQVVPARRTMTQRQRTELSLRTEAPIVVEYDGKAVNFREAHLIGRETDLRVGGAISPGARLPWDLKVIGNLNLGILQAFHEDVVSSGAAIINGSVRGALSDPQLAGRMEVKDASFYLANLPNGFDNMNGVILFDQRRANIERLRATTGGGELVLSGFVGFGGPEVLYQLQGRAEHVRIRYPEDVSTTANASLTLAGTTSRSLLTGVVTVVRAGFNPRTDIASVLANNPAPMGAPVIQTPFLRGMQFDVRLETAPNLQFQTSLTSDLQAEADLRLRGTAAKPVLLGRVLISQGEIQFFGNRYLINRGEIGFFNPVRIEPVLDFDLETRVRAVLVNIRFNGPLNRLNVSYRSDPPLQSTEIIALLAVGRAPGSNSVLASSQAVTGQGVLGGGTNNLLGQAVAAPISSRLQRFFGVSRLKIDPQLTGLSAVPQARLTIEQQISRDITLTYVTNLSQANQQIIRLEWDMSRSWSVVAVREENGVFGVDFFFKKRFR